jgi:hypothetical protein
MEFKMAKAHLRSKYSPRRVRLEPKHRNLLLLTLMQETSWLAGKGRVQMEEESCRWQLPARQHAEEQSGKDAQVEYYVLGRLQAEISP